MLTKNLRLFGHKIPLYPLFMVSGAVCDTFQALIDYCISSVYTSEFAKETVCWTLSYTLSIVLRHSSHRLLVFGDYEGSYCMSLTRTYMAYSSAIVISMFANHQLVAFFGFERREAWVLTMLFTGIYNFFILKASWRVINKATGTKSAEEQQAMLRESRERAANNAVENGDGSNGNSNSNSNGNGNRSGLTASGNNYYPTLDEGQDVVGRTPARKRSSSMRTEGKIINTHFSNSGATSGDQNTRSMVKEKDSSLALDLA
jgi:hypothetical protein